MGCPLIRVPTELGCPRIEVPTNQGAHSIGVPRQQPRLWGRARPPVPREMQALKSH